MTRRRVEDKLVCHYSRGDTRYPRDFKFQYRFYIKIFEFDGVRNNIFVSVSEFFRTIWQASRNLYCTRFRWSKRSWSLNIYIAEKSRKRVFVKRMAVKRAALRNLHLIFSFANLFKRYNLRSIIAAILKLTQVRIGYIIFIAFAKLREFSFGA